MLLRREDRKCEGRSYIIPSRLRREGKPNQVMKVQGQILLASAIGFLIGLILLS